MEWYFSALLDKEQLDKGSAASEHWGCRSDYLQSWNLKNDLFGEER